MAGNDALVFYLDTSMIEALMAEVFMDRSSRGRRGVA